MKKVLKKLSRFIVSFFAIFSILFTMSIIIFAAISQYVYEDCLLYTSDAADE